jgi:hypothetical protein
MKRSLLVTLVAPLFVLLIAVSFISFKPAYAALSKYLDSTPPATETDGWVKDAKVTFAGKSVNRSKDFMDWTLTNYKWNYSDGPLTNSWKAIRNIVYTMSVLAVLITGFRVVIKGGEDVGVAVFIKEFIIALILVTFSFALAHLLFQIADIFQLFFFQTAGTSGGVVTSKDLINISFPSQNFTGYRRAGSGYDESAFISLLLVQLSSITFYVIGSLLTLRKIILWFFLISSPIYPIILIYKPIKNTGKVWIKELLRWLLYAPLFALFLAAVVMIWKGNILVLPFQFGSNASTYPTSISILIGGPGQALSLKNSLNYNDTFTQYIIALLMLWAAIIMPFILLQFILDAMAKYDFGMNSVSGFVNTLRANNATAGSSPIKKTPPPGPLPFGKFPGGLARELPKHNTSKVETSIKNQTVETISKRLSDWRHTGNSSSNSSTSQFGNISVNQTSSQSHQAGTSGLHSAAPQTNFGTNTHTNSTVHTTAGFHHTSQSTMSGKSAVSSQLKPEIMSKPTSRLINFSIPNMRDIVKFETARLNKGITTDTELKATEESLIKIANPKASSNATEEKHFEYVHDQLNKETAEGDVLAESILSAAYTAQNVESKEQSGAEASSELPDVILPTVNEIQTVSYEDYEVVKAMWLENYQQVDIPAEYSNRISWIEDDIKEVSKAITLLSSSDQIKVQEGLASVSNILPFLLIGGFSQTEVIAYLQAKCTAAKASLAELAKKEDERETLLKKSTSAQKTATKELSREAEITSPEITKNENNQSNS